MSEYITIPLTKNQFAIVDIADSVEVNKHSWSAVYCKSTKSYYARTEIKGKTVYLHNFLLNHDPSESKNKITVDHVNRDTLDYRRDNLERRTKAQQMINRGIFTTNTSKRTGVSFNNAMQAWISFYNKDGKTIQNVFTIKKYGIKDSRIEAENHRYLVEHTLDDYSIALSLNKKKLDIVSEEEKNDMANRLNTKKKERTKTSEYIGVHFDESCNSWVSTWFHNGKQQKKRFKIGHGDNKTSIIAEKAAYLHRINTLTLLSDSKKENLALKTISRQKINQKKLKNNNTKRAGNKLEIVSKENDIIDILHTKKRKRTSEHRGVSFAKSQNSWISTWTDNGKREKKKFKIGRNGNTAENGEENARLHRENALALLSNSKKIV